ncbi:hypothetical protein BZA77DRAFT_325393 [Pyronema omphalodes]|nr:hypothetical protein BZA77DRAFT_325393 [Pyronema omphalodes]
MSASPPSTLRSRRRAAGDSVSNTTTSTVSKPEETSNTAATNTATTITGEQTSSWKSTITSFLSGEALVQQYPKPQQKSSKAPSMTSSTRGMKSYASSLASLASSIVSTESEEYTTTTTSGTAAAAAAAASTATTTATIANKHKATPSSHRPATPPPSPPAQDQQKTLVYVHPVTPSTTLEGVVIAYDTIASAVLRTNSLWAGDAVQSRRELLIPVDSCQVRGRPVTEEEKSKTKIQQQEEEEEQDDENAARRWKFHSKTILPGNLGVTTVGVLLPRRAKRKKQNPEQEEVPIGSAVGISNGIHELDQGRPRWMTPGVHSFHPEEERELELPSFEWGELARGAGARAGAVEGWMRRFGEGFWTTVDGAGELIEMVSDLKIKGDNDSPRSSTTNGAPRRRAVRDRDV